MIRKRRVGLAVGTVLVWLALCPGQNVSGEDNSFLRKWAGVWAIGKDLGAPGISALTDSEARRLLGQRIRIAEHEVLLPGEECGRPSFRSSTQTTTDFLSGFNITATQFPLVGKTVEILDVKCERSVTYQVGRLSNGCVFYPRDGRFFQLQIIGDSRRWTRLPLPKCLERPVR